jgi:putative restriction endonuclease
VNQNQTYRHEVPGGYLWSPVKRSDGARNYFYDTMTEVRPGDLVFSFCDTHIKALGIATHAAEPSVKPDFGTAGGNWSEYGWLVQVEFQELDHPVRPKGHMDLLAPPCCRRSMPPCFPMGTASKGSISPSSLELWRRHYEPWWVTSSRSRPKRFSSRTPRCRSSNESSQPSRVAWI